MNIDTADNPLLDHAAVYMHTNVCMQIHTYACNLRVHVTIVKTWPVAFHTKNKKHYKNF